MIGIPARRRLIVALSPAILLAVLSLAACTVNPLQSRPLTAAEILQLCDGTQTVAGLIGVLQSKYPGAELRADVVEFLGQAVQKGWVEWILPP